MSFTVEDALEKLFEIACDSGGAAMIDQWTDRFVTNVYRHVAEQRPLSTEQSRIIQKLVREHRDLLLQHGSSPDDLDVLMKHPSHRQPPYQSSNIPKEVRYLGDNKLAFRFKYNDIIIGEIKNLKPRVHFGAHDLAPRFDHQHRIWIVSVTRDTLAEIIGIISRHRFRFDHGVLKYLTLASNSGSGKSHFIYDPEGDQIVVNICDNEFIASLVKDVLGGESF